MLGRSGIFRLAILSFPTTASLAGGRGCSNIVEVWIKDAEKEARRAVDRKDRLGEFLSRNRYTFTQAY